MYIQELHPTDMSKFEVLPCGINSVMCAKLHIITADNAHIFLNKHKIVGCYILELYPNQE